MKNGFVDIDNLQTMAYNRNFAQQTKSKKIPLIPNISRLVGRAKWKVLPLQRT